MNKILAASILAALLPLSAICADKSANSDLSRNDGRTKFVSYDDSIIPVDLEAASKAYDLVLPNQPVHLTADSIVVRNADNYVHGRGNVDVQQGMDELHTGYLEGNTKSQIYYTPGPMLYVTGELSLTATGVTYRGDGSVSMDAIEGFIDPETYIRGTDVEFVNGVGYVRHGVLTTPHAVAKTPDYYLTGDDIRIYPGEKFIAENTKLWVKHICLLTYGHYEGRLDEEKNNTWLFTLLPRPTYNSDDGVGVRGNARIPMNESGDLNFDFDYSLNSKNGFKPSARIEQRTKAGTFRFGYGSEKSTDNDDNIWATKWPQLEYFLPRLYIGDTGLYIDGSADWGRWSESGRPTGSHRGIKTELTHKPLPLWNKANIRFYTGYRRDWYGAYGAERRDPYWGTVFTQRFNDRLWTTLWYKKHNISGYTPYRFDTIDDPHQKGFSIGYVLTPRDTFVFSLAKNLNTDRISDRHYTWIRDLHSFTAIITYKQEDEEWDIEIMPKDLRF